MREKRNKRQGNKPLRLKDLAHCFDYGESEIIVASLYAHSPELQGLKVIGQVHDSIIFELPNPDLKVFGKIGE